MTIKQFKRRVINGLIEPDLFKMPVGKKIDDAFIFKINVVESNVDIPILCYYTPTGLNNNIYQFDATVFYNLKDEKGNYVSKINYPELFWDFPCSGYAHADDVFYLSENMIENNINPILNIDWGDGCQEQIPFIKQTINVQGHIFQYDFLTTPRVFTSTHNYRQTGEYIVKVSGYASTISIYDKSFTFNNSPSNFILQEIISWGDLKVRYLYGTLLKAARDSSSFPLFPFDKMKKIIAIEYLHGRLWDTRNESGDYVWNDQKQGLKIDWEIIGGDDFFHHFLNLISVRGCFYYGCVTYVPNYCFKNNKYLMNISDCFYNCEIEYIGEYACANLQFLIKANDFFYFAHSQYREVEYYKNHLIMSYIGDSVFENCINLGNGRDSSGFLHHLVVPSGIGFTAEWHGWDKIGNRVFKNCRNLNCAEGNNNCWFNLTYIGDELFSGCEKLNTISYWFIFAPNIEYIGKDMFKGCRQLQFVNASFMYCGFKLNIPDNFFYDVEFNKNNPVYHFEFQVDYQTNVQNTVKLKDNFEKFMSTIHNNYISNEQWETYYKELKPNLYQSLNERIQNFDKDITNNMGYHFGKNMFNERFLMDLGENNIPLSRRTTSLFDGHVDEYEYNSSGQLAKMIIHNRNTGEAPPLWKYGIKPVKFGEIATNEEYKGIYYYSDGLQYDNADEIPKEEPWVTVYPHKQ